MATRIDLFQGYVITLTNRRPSSPSRVFMCSKLNRSTMATPAKQSKMSRFLTIRPKTTPLTSHGPGIRQTDEGARPDHNSQQGREVTAGETISEEVTTTTPTLTASSSTSGHVKLNFRPAWKDTFTWVDYDEASGKMYCSLCRRYSCHNTMGDGTTNLKMCTLKRHTQNKQHMMAVRAESEKKNMAKAVNKAITNEENAVLVCMQVVHWLCKEVVPLSKYSSIMQLLRKLNTPYLEALQIADSTNYGSYNTALDLLKSISDTIDKSVTARMHESPVIMILTDESTDIVVHHKLVINCRIINPVNLQPSTLFLTDIRIQTATGKGICDEIRRHLLSRNINLSQVNGLGTDGASVMTGRKEGLVGQMLRSNPHLISCHCGAHRVALVSEQAAKNIAGMKEYQETLETLYYHFRKSPAKSDKLQSIQKILQDPQIKYREVHSVRWLSFYQVVEAVWRTLDSLLTYLDEASAGGKDSAALGLKRKICNVFFVKSTYFLMDVLQPIMALNLFFQKKDVDIGSVQPALDVCIKDLEYLKTGNPDPAKRKFSQQLETDLVDGTKFKGHHSLNESRFQAETTQTNFTQAMIDNLHKRFPETELLNAFSFLSLRPVHKLAGGGGELAVWGNSQLETLVQHFGNPASHTFKSGEPGEELTTTTEPMLDPIESMVEWTLLKQLVVTQNYPTTSAVDLWGLITTHHKSQFPNLLTLAAIAIAHPLHTSDCERSFSAQNQVVTPLRNRLNSDHIDQILRVKIEGDTVDYLSVLQTWRTDKQRKIFGKSGP